MRKVSHSYDFVGHSHFSRELSPCRPSIYNSKKQNSSKLELLIINHLGWLGMYPHQDDSKRLELGNPILHLHRPRDQMGASQQMFHLMLRHKLNKKKFWSTWNGYCIIWYNLYIYIYHHIYIENPSKIRGISIIPTQIKRFDISRDSTLPHPVQPINSSTTSGKHHCTRHQQTPPLFQL